MIAENGPTCVLMTETLSAFGVGWMTVECHITLVDRQSSRSRFKVLYLD
jgi:hypothetical protein